MVATIIGQIACHDNALPQGAPTSPIISNLIGQILDNRLARLAKRRRCHYTRYADDLTFSTTARTFPIDLCFQRNDGSHIWQLGHGLRDCIERTGFSVNEAKTRMQIIGSRQEVTGLIVNDKVNVKSEYYRTVRSMCHALFKTGSYFIPNKFEGEDEECTQINELGPLEGRLSFIYYVKDRRDLNSKEKKERDFKKPIGFERLYKRFLMYKYFVASAVPVLITEGKTDVVYLSCAIRSLKSEFPLLIKQEDDEASMLFKFIHSTYVNQRILNLGEGYGGMKNLLNVYEKSISGYHIRQPHSPVIFVVDNDSGGKSFFDEIKTKCKITITLASNELYFYLGNNLYLVKTPSEGSQESCIEDLFSPRYPIYLAERKRI